MLQTLLQRHFHRILTNIKTKETGKQDASQPQSISLNGLTPHTYSRQDAEANADNIVKV